MADEGRFEVRAVFHVKDTIRECSLMWWKTEINARTGGYYEVEDIMEGDSPQSEDFDYSDVAKFVAQVWNASGDYYEYVDADSTVWGTVEVSAQPEVCAHEGCGRVKSSSIHRLVDEDDMRTTHKFEEKTDWAKEMPTVDRDILPKH